MSGTGEIREHFAGEEHEFRVRLGEIRRIEDKCGTGIGIVASRLARMASALSVAPDLSAALAFGVELHADDVREPIYQGLLGGGMKSGDASRLLKREIDDRGLTGVLDNVVVALSVLVGSQRVPETDAVGEGGAKPMTDAPSSPSTSPTSTEPGSSSD